MTGDKMPITLESTVTRCPALLISALSDRELVLLNIERGAYFGMEDVAKRIWDQLDEPRRVSDLCATLLARYAVDPGTCRRELLAFLTELQAKDLILVSMDAPCDVHARAIDGADGGAAAASTGVDAGAGANRRDPAGTGADAAAGAGAGADA